MNNFDKYVAQVSEFFSQVRLEHGTAAAADKAVKLSAGGIASFLKKPRVFRPDTATTTVLLENKVITKKLLAAASIERHSSTITRKRNSRHQRSESQFLSLAGVQVATTAASELESLKTVSTQHIQNAQEAVRLARAYQAAAKAFDDALAEPVPVSL